MEGEKGEHEERRNFGEWKECKYSITGSRGLNLPVGCRLFHVSKSESPLKKQKPGCPVSSRARLLCPDPVHYDPVMPSVSVWGACLSVSRSVCLCLTDRELELCLLSASAAPAAQLCSDTERERERGRGSPLPPGTCRHFDCFQMCVRVCACVCVSVCARAPAGEGGRSQQG